MCASMRAGSRRREEAEGGNVDRLRMEFEGRAESMADVSDEGGCENTELLAIEMRRGDVG